MHISPCVVSVMAVAAADFPGLPKLSTTANLSQYTSVRVTIGHLRVTIGHHRVIMGHLRLTIGSSY